VLPGHQLTGPSEEEEEEEEEGEEEEEDQYMFLKGRNFKF
jgi:hypothetical protein